MTELFRFYHAILATLHLKARAGDANPGSTAFVRTIANTVYLTVRGELVEPPASQPEPFDKLRANGISLK